MVGGRGHNKITRKSKSQKAGLVFPVSRVHRALKTSKAAKRISAGSSVFLAAVLEYVTAEICELAGNCARDMKKRRIIPRHILLALKTDEEFDAFMRKAKVVIPEGGVPPSINSFLLSAKDRVLAHTQKSTPVSSPVASPAPKKKAVPKAAPAPKVKRAATVESLGHTQLFLGQNLKIVKSNLAKYDQADAVVHPTNGQLSTAGQVGRELVRFGGSAFQQILSDARPTVNLRETECCITDGGDLNAKFVIHCNSPSWHGPESSEQLAKAIDNVLRLADSKNLRSVALPSIGSGANGFPKDEAARIILQAINRYFQGIMASSIKEVHFVLYDQDSVNIYNQVYAHEFPQ